jgi:hypothetical protein
MSHTGRNDPKLLSYSLGIVQKGSASGTAITVKADALRKFREASGISVGK